MKESPERRELGIIEIIKPLPISAKREIIQMINGLRPVAEIMIMSRFKDAMLPVVGMLRDRGFAVAAKEFGQKLIFFVSKDQDLAHEASGLMDLKGVTDSQRFGELMGFPPGSIDAFVHNKEDFLGTEEVEALIGFPNHFVNVSLSRSNVEESIQYLKDTYKVLLEQYPTIFEEGLPVGEDVEDFKKKVSDFVNG